MVPPVTWLGENSLKRSNRLILLVGVLLAILAFVGIYLITTGHTNQTQTAVPTTANTVYAAVDIPLGVEVTDAMLREQADDITARDPTAFENKGLVIGQTARRNIAAGTQLTAADFQPATTVVETPPGLRAMAVQVDQVSGVGTLINPGDYVDLVVGFTGEKFPIVILDPAVEGAGQFTTLPGVNQTSVKVLVPGVQVLGTLVPPPAAGAAPPEPGATPAPALTGQQQIVIVAVTAQQTEIIKFSQMDGTVTLVLRSADDFRDDAGNPIVPEETVTSGVILRTLVEEYGVLIPELIETVLPAQQTTGGQSPAP